MRKDNKPLAGDHKAKDFQAAIRLLEKRLRDIEDSEEVIHGLLAGAAEFYGASRAAVIEADREMRVGILSYEWCAEGVAPRRHELPNMAAECFPRWHKALSSNQSVVIPDVSAVKEACQSEYDFFRRYGIKSLLAAPFSKRINKGFIVIDEPTRCQTDPTFLFIMSYAIVLELNEIKKAKSIAASRRASKYRTMDVYVNCLGNLEINNIKGTLTDEDFSSDLCYNLFALLLLNSKRPLPIERLADTLWPDDGLDNPYRAVGNLAYRLRRILSIIDLEDLVVGKSGTFVFNEKYSIYTDFDRFEGMYLRLERENNPETRYTLYNNAIALYRGKLLSKIAHQHWIMPKSVYYHNIYLHLVKEHIRNKLKQEEFFTAHRAAIDALSFDPYDSDLNTDMAIIMFYQGGIEPSKCFLKKAREFMSDEQIRIVKAHWEGKIRQI